jgi:hypothetical protein
MNPASATAITNPFPGLRPFREEEEHLFFGRELQVDAMVDKLASGVSWRLSAVQEVVSPLW